MVIIGLTDRARGRHDYPSSIENMRFESRNEKKPFTEKERPSE
jgi:hypothetical protein